MATTAEYAYERIYEVLVDGQGTNRVLARADRFARGFPPGLPAQMRSTRAKERPTVFVVINAASVESFASGEATDSHLYRVNVAIYRDHWLGYKGDPSEVEASLVTATNAFFKVRAALCWTGNLTQTESGNATGFAGLALNGAGATTKLVRSDAVGGDHRLLQFLDSFTAEFDFSPDG